MSDHQAFNVYLHGKWIDKIFYSSGISIDPDEVRRSLIHHDGYDEAITVKRQRREKKS